MTDLKVKVIPDLSEMNRQFKGLGLGGVSGGGGAVEKEVKQQTTGIKEIAGGVTIGNALLKTIGLIFEALDPVIRPILQLIKILVLIIFMPLIPFLKPAFMALAGIAKFMVETLKTTEGQAAGGLVPAGGGIGGIIGVYLGAMIGSAFPVVGTIIGASVGALVGTIVGGILTTIAIKIGSVLAEIIKALAGLDWNKIINSIITYLSVVGEDAGKIIGAIVTALTELDWSDIMTGLVTFVSDVFKKFKESLPEPLQTALDNIGSFLQGFSNELFGTDGKSGVWGQIKNALEWINETLFGTDGKSGIYGDFSDALKKFKDDVVSKVVEISKALSPILDFLIWVKNKLFGDSTPENEKQDFISRPGQSPVAFSSQDTIVGFKGASPFGGGVNYSPTFNISGDVSSDSMKKVLEAHDREFLSKLRAYGTAGGRTFNV